MTVPGFLVTLLQVLLLGAQTTTNVCAFHNSHPVDSRPTKHALAGTWMTIRDSRGENGIDHAIVGQNVENLFNPHGDSMNSYDHEELSQQHRGKSISLGSILRPDPPTASSVLSTRMRDYRSELASMTRPENFPGVVLFHMLGTWLVVPACASSAGGSSKRLLYWLLLRSPSMIVTLVALLLTSSTSMLVNDYYDYKLGNDAYKPNKPMQRVPLIVVKRFVSYLYAAALICSALVPGVPARLMVVMGLILTFLYTEHLKPVTWVKNAVCACLIALSPLTSGLAAIGTAAGWTNPSHTVLEGVAASSPVEVAIPSIWPLARLVCLLFVGFLGREITMDMNDVQDDTAHSVRTVPVKYGYRFASHVAWACSLGVTGLSLFGPIVALVVNNWMFTPALVRRMGFAVVGGTAQLRRYWQVFRSEGRDAAIVDVAINEGLLSVVLILASFA
jgi:4-hydroxybenzoate polyprenyltransferase